MKFGVVFPQTEYGNDAAAIKEFAQAAEALGYHHILAYEHVLGANPACAESWKRPYTYKHPFHEPFSLFSFMAAVTEKIAFTTGILILPQRQTALVAKQAAELDLLSGGRLRLGVGLGWNEVEYIALNQNFSTRGKRVEEQVDVLRKLWTEPLVTYEGKWHKILDAGLNPLPVQRPIPIWFGGHHENVLRRVAAMGDGWLPNYRRVVDAQAALEKLRTLLREAGRTWDEIGVEPRLQYKGGDPEVWKKILDEWQEAGATHVTFNTMRAGLDTPEDHIGAIRRFAEAMGL